jgi:hypothetical protein
MKASHLYKTVPTLLNIVLVHLPLAVDKLQHNRVLPVKELLLQTFFPLWRRAPQQTLRTHRSLEACAAL